MTINFNLHAHPERRLVHIGYDDIEAYYEYDWDTNWDVDTDGTVASERIGSGHWDYCISGYFDGESWRLASWEVLTDCDINEVWVWPADDAPSFETIEEMLEWVLDNRHEK